MAGVKEREAQMNQDDSSELTTRIEDPQAMVGACYHSADIDPTGILKFNIFSEYIDQSAAFVRRSNLANEGSCTFTGTSRSRIIDINMTHNAKAQFAVPI
jgi:hypothetical protein